MHKPQTLTELLLEKRQNYFIFIKKRVRQKELAEDILQDVCYITLRVDKIYEEITNPLSLLITIILNKIYSALRKEYNKYDIIDEDAEWYDLEIPSNGHETILNQITLAEVNGMISRYGPLVTEIFFRVAQGEKRKEIAVHLRIPLPEVHNIISKHRKKFRKWRKRQYPGD